MSIDSVKLLYNDVNNVRFTSTQYSDFWTRAGAVVASLRPDLAMDTITGKIVAPFSTASSFACIKLAAPYTLIRVEAIKGTGNATVSRPRCVDYNEVIARDPQWGTYTATSADGVTEYTVDPFNSSLVLFNAYPSGDPNVHMVVDKHTVTNSNAFTDELMNLYTLYLCYSADSTSQQDAAKAQAYLQQFNQMANEDRDTHLKTLSHYVPSSTMLANIQGGTA